MSRTRSALLAGLLAVTVAACGDDDADGAGAGGATRTIEVDMVDLAFEPSTIDVDAGETVRFVFTNNGEVPHDAFIGDFDAQAGHAADMADMADMGDTADEHGGGHGEGSDAITVEPGERAELVHTFGADDDELLIGCHQPGHYEAGMVASIRVSR